MAVTISARFWKDCSTLKQMQSRYLKMEVSVVFTIGFIVFLVLLTCIFVSSVILLSAFFLRMGTLFFRTSNGKPFFVSLPCRVLKMFSHTTCGILCWSCYSTSRLAAFFELNVDEIDLAKIALSCHFALDLPCYQEGAYGSA